MVNTKRIVLAALAVAVVVVVVIGLMPDEKKKVRKQFARLSELVGKQTGENMLVTAAQGQAISELFTDPCELQSNIQSLGGTYSRREAAMVSAALRSQFDTITLSLVDLKIELPEKDKARVTLTAKLDAMRGGERIGEVRELDCTLLKRDRAWLFSTCRVVDVFQK